LGTAAGQAGLRPPSSFLGGKHNAESIVSGGQTGADRGGLIRDRAGDPHSGWCPKGRRAEDGPIPTRYRLQETAGSSYPERTKKNVLDSMAQPVFTFGALSGGSALPPTSPSNEPSLASTSI